VIGTQAAGRGLSPGSDGKGGGRETTDRPTRCRRLSAREGASGGGGWVTPSLPSAPGLFGRSTSEGGGAFGVRFSAPLLVGRKGWSSSSSVRRTGTDLSSR